MPQTIQPLDATRQGLDTAWANLGQPGTWWSGPERIAIATQVRAARDCGLCRRRKAALSPYTVAETHDGVAPLPAVVVDAVHRLSTDPGRITERWYQALLSSGLEPEHVVEMIGVVGVVSIGDTLSAALNLPIRELPDADNGEPSREKAPGLEVACAWVPTVDPARAEGPVKMMYDMVEGTAGFVFHVARALTAVPSALQDFFAAFLVNYSTHGPTAGDLTRPQVELLAATTSSLNDCFY